MEEQAKGRTTTTGKCNLCGRTLAKAGMTRHLQSCWQRQAASGVVPTGPRARERRVFLIVAGDRHSSIYWMHLAVPAAAKLVVLDSFLRDTWLECCGHMSAFEIDGQTYFSSAAREMEGRSMNFEIGRVLRPGSKAFYEYDFGTTTELALSVAAERVGLSDRKSIQVLARNDPPEIICQSCGKPATQVCAQCIYEGEGWLCDECAGQHACGEEMLLPVVNSPRVGMCAYEG
ncbi:MAG: hypothetical protein HY675_09315 [Chloroflexi bacterium]|nr:hypothetical protein [Chloroflexota bacterium]